VLFNLVYLILLGFPLYENFIQLRSLSLVLNFDMLINVPYILWPSVCSLFIESQIIISQLSFQTTNFFSQFIIPNLFFKRIIHQSTFFPIK